MADEPHYHSGGDSAAVKRKYEDSAPRRATGFSDGPPPSDSAPSYNNVPPPMDEIQIAKQKAQEIAARLFSSAEAKRPKFDNGGSGWDSNDNSGFSSGPNALPMPSPPCCVPGFFSAFSPESTPLYDNVPSPLDEIQIAKREAQESVARLFTTAEAKHPKFNNGGFFAASSLDSVQSYTCPMDEIQIAKQKAQEIVARLFKTAEAKHPKFSNGGIFATSSLDSVPSYNCVPSPMDEIQIAKQKAREIVARIFKTAEAKHPMFINGGSFASSSPDSVPSYNCVPPPMDEIQIAKEKAQEIVARLFKTAEVKRPKFSNGGFFAAASPDLVPSYNCMPPPMDEIQIAKQKAKVIAARVFKASEAKHSECNNGGFSAASPLDSGPPYNYGPPPMDEIQIAKQKAKEIAARVFKASEAKHSEFNNGGFSAASLLDSGPPYNYVPLPMDEIQIAKRPKLNSRADWVSQDTCDFSSSSTDFGSTTPSVPSSYGYGNPSKKIEIPQGRVGVIIGKAGETIKYLQLQSGAKIQVTRDMDADPHSLTREVELTGSEESIEKAEKLIKDVLAEAESGGSGTVSRRVSGQSGGAEQFVMQIPSRKVGLVIGKGGETIKNFQASTGARIQVIPLHPPPGDTSTERTVQIDGTSEQIEAAKQLVNEVISENRQRNPMGGSYSQQGYQARPPGQQMQQQGYYGYAQPGAYPGQQAQYSQQPYASYPQAAGGYATSWDQSSAQQTTQGGGGYDYYGQQQSQQTQPPGASAPANASSYGYGQQGQGYGQEGYGGYASAPQSGYGQQHGYNNPTSGYNSASQTTDGQNAAYGGQGDNTSQAPPTSAPQSGYNQPPGPNSSYPPQGSSQPGYGAPPTSQPEYGTQPSGYGGYGPPPTQKPPAYGQQPQQSPNAASAQTGYAQPSYGAPPAYGTAGYAQPPYGAPPATQPGYGAYGGSYGGGYQPPAYSADPAATAAPPTQVAQAAPKASPQQN